MLWDELQKKDLVVLKLIAVAMGWPPKTLRYIPFTEFFWYVGKENVEEIRVKNWRLFSVLPPKSEELKKKHNVKKFAVFYVVKDITPDPLPEKYYLVPVDEAKAYKFIRNLEQRARVEQLS
jgi:hypothetical protein